MIRSLSISAKQAELIVAAQGEANKTQRELSLIVSAILLGHDVEGQVVSVDTDKNLLNVEVANEKPDLKVEA